MKRTTEIIAKTEDFLMDESVLRGQQRIAVSVGLQQSADISARFCFCFHCRRCRCFSVGQCWLLRNAGIYSSPAFSVVLCLSADFLYDKIEPAENKDNSFRTVNILLSDSSLPIGKSLAFVFWWNIVRKRGFVPSEFVKGLFKENRQTILLSFLKTHSPPQAGALVAIGAWKRGRMKGKGEIRADKRATQVLRPMHSDKPMLPFLKNKVSNRSPL